MTPDDIIVRPVLAADRASWFEMWAQYCAFYGADIPAHVSEATFGRLIAAEGAMRGLVAHDASSKAVLGFANYVVHPFSWSERPAGYLEDLYTRTDARGRGVGRALIDRLIALGRSGGWARVYWMTQHGNAVARRLYDRYAAVDDFVRYAVDLDE